MCMSHFQYKSECLPLGLHCTCNRQCWNGFFLPSTSITAMNTCIVIRVCGRRTLCSVFTVCRWCDTRFMSFLGFLLPCWLHSFLLAWSIAWFIACFISWLCDVCLLAYLLCFMFAFFLVFFTFCLLHLLFASFFAFLLASWLYALLAFLFARCFSFQAICGEVQLNALLVNSFFLWQMVSCWLCSSIHSWTNCQL